LRPRDILSDHEHRLAPVGDIELTLLNGAAEIEKIRILNDERPVNAFFLKIRLELFPAGGQFA